MEIGKERALRSTYKKSDESQMCWATLWDEETHPGSKERPAHIRESEKE